MTESPSNKPEQGALEPISPRKAPYTPKPDYPGKPGPKPKVIDWKQVETLTILQCTDVEVAWAIGVSVDTLTRRPEYADIKEKGISIGNMSLRREQYRQAMNGNITMLIWLGKNRLGQKDKIEHTGDGTSPIAIMLGPQRRETE